MARKNQPRKGGKFVKDPNSRRSKKAAAKQQPYQRRPTATAAAFAAPDAPSDAVNAVDFTAATDGVADASEANHGAPDTAPEGTDSTVPPADDAVPDPLDYFDPQPANSTPDSATTDADVPSETPTTEKKPKGDKKVENTFMDPEDAADMYVAMVAGIWQVYMKVRHPYIIHLRPEQQAMFVITEEEAKHMHKAAKLYAKYKPIPISPEGNLIGATIMEIGPKLYAAEQYRAAAKKAGKL